MLFGWLSRTSAAAMQHKPPQAKLLKGNRGSLPQGPGCKGAIVAFTIILGVCMCVRVCVSVSVSVLETKQRLLQGPHL